MPSGRTNAILESIGLMGFCSSHTSHSAPSDAAATASSTEGKRRITGPAIAFSTSCTYEANSRLTTDSAKLPENLVFRPSSSCRGRYFTFTFLGFARNTMLASSTSSLHSTMASRFSARSRACSSHSARCLDRNLRACPRLECCIMDAISSRESPSILR